MTVVDETIRPPKPPGVIAWVRQNLFNNWLNALLTIIALLLVYGFLSVAIRWLITSADWRPITQFPMLYMVGQFPRDQLWRIGISLIFVSIVMGLSWGVWGGLIQSFAITIGALLGVAALMPIPLTGITITVRVIMLINIPLIFLGYYVGKYGRISSRFVTIAWIVITLLILILLRGFEISSLLPLVPTTLWGGLLVTLILAIGGIVLSFPIGVLLALGRRSSLPVVKAFSIAFIEGIRGVPLITILFMFSLILAVFLPTGSRFDRLLRALIGITIFSAAYMAENVRGGLAAVSPGQIEAAKAVGMNGFQINLFIVLPQALRAVIPAIVGQFISLFKDTTLVIILGINELLGIGRAAINANPEYVQLQLEVYLFIAAVFWIFSYAMSYSSRRLETALGVGER